MAIFEKIIFQTIASFKWANFKCAKSDFIQTRTIGNILYSA